MKRINIEQIPFDLVYEGYLWYSNAQKPEIVSTISKEQFTSLPFIVEGNLYNQEKKVSISIKNIDGQYLVTMADLSNIKMEKIEEYIAHDLKDVKKIKLYQHWQESEPDELLEGMTTLIPVWVAFVGFSK